ncbi:LysR family transcriptional regulator [Stackebrandtia nassauensis]|uniref:Transcriptional regulator, LysR family n=1 Tax=Stackebrandtia nassauensis (strain DSM 44728 / CIP 108903 / NRRL B-16338 / NBRC 102104 / LLR-40K-21) TaxID=446470 RepID=D3Q8I1_STANL|nr:LysR family transcriptional regulator [Stackebrandtia nassauensis]ADD42555.1 transcriptional regulator, LysR family [Stackebrandtia nassauensis DSM 44728]
MLEKHELDAFLTLAEELHFGRTARRLRVSAARVSQTIQKLERRVGVPLFNRTSRRVELTEVGRRLRDEIAPAWQSITTAVETAIATGKGITGTLRVAFVSAAAGQFLVRATQRFRARHPDCEVRIREAQIGELLPWLRDGDTDLALGPVPVHSPDVDSGPVLFSDARMLAVPAAHPLARKESVDAEDLAALPLLQLPDTVDEHTRTDRSSSRTPGGRPIQPGPVGATFNEMLTLISAGEGAFPVGAQVKKYYVRPDVAYVPFRDAPPVDWGLLWRKDNATARVRAFNEAAAETGATA